MRYSRILQLLLQGVVGAGVLVQIERLIYKNIKAHGRFAWRWRFVAKPYDSWNR